MVNNYGQKCSINSKNRWKSSQKFYKRLLPITWFGFFDPIGDAL